MLSYRHSFHAGNHADVLKHLVLFLCADYLCQKPKPLVYVDTHAGAGLYRLDENHAQKNKEYLTGISRLREAGNPPELIERFLAMVDHASNRDSRLYPGSPAIAQALLLPEHRLMLHELHPTDHRLLQSTMAGDRRVRIKQSDGYHGLLSIVPPRERRALVLIDPPYEIKQDYERVAVTLKQAVQRFRSGVYCAWYPVVDRTRSTTLVRSLGRLGCASLTAELHIQPPSHGHGMTGSGMVVLNPPYRLEQQLRDLLPWLVRVLSPEQGSFSVTLDDAGRGG